jgi:hypothetical protein
MAFAADIRVWLYRIIDRVVRWTFSYLWDNTFRENRFYSHYNSLLRYEIL